MDSKSYWSGVALALVGACVIGPIISNFIHPTKKFPAVTNVQAGYVVPSNLEIKLQDLDQSGQKKTILNYNGTNYLFTLDQQGRPSVQAYEVRPAEVVPKH